MGKLLLLVLVVVGIARALMVDDLGGTIKILILVVTLGIATAAAIVSAKTLRKRFALQHFLRTG